jgi:hypothetical protein
MELPSGPLLVAKLVEEKIDRSRVTNQLRPGPAIGSLTLGLMDALAEVEKRPPQRTPEDFTLDQSAFNVSVRRVAS